MVPPADQRGARRLPVEGDRLPSLAQRITSHPNRVVCIEGLLSPRQPHRLPPLGGGVEHCVVRRRARAVEARRVEELHEPLVIDGAVPALAVVDHDHQPIGRHDLPMMVRQPVAAICEGKRVGVGSEDRLDLAEIVEHARITERREQHASHLTHGNLVEARAPAALRASEVRPHDLRGLQLAVVDRVAPLVIGADEAG